MEIIRKNRATSLIIGLAAAALLGACANTPSVPSIGDEIRTSGFGNLGEDWDKADRRVIAAQRAVRSSNERIERGEKLVRQAKRNQRRGEEQIERGQRDLRDAERALATATSEKTLIEDRFRAVATGDSLSATVTE
ncbi:MAG: hypothetical protein AAF583_00120 [Pseudomonadota bacterium]